MPIVVITGASQGLGAAIAEAFAAEPDVHLALLARSEANLAQVAERCRVLGAQVQVFPCDVTDAEAVKRVADAIRKIWGAADVLVNNAGLFRSGAFLDTSLAEFEEQISVNLTSAFIVTQAFLPKMLAQKAGHVFFMASVASIRAYVGGASYCAAKHGLLGLARVVREECKPHGIRVTTLLPGATRTPSWDGVDVLDERLMHPQDVAQTLLAAWKLSGRAVMEEVILRPQLGDL